MIPKDSALRTENGRLVVPEAWEAYASRVMAELLSRRHNRTVKAVKKAAMQEIIGIKNVSRKDKTRVSTVP